MGPILSKQWRGTVPRGQPQLCGCGAKGLFAYEEIGRCLEWWAGSRQLYASDLPLQKRPHSSDPTTHHAFDVLRMHEYISCFGRADTGRKCCEGPED